MKTLITCKEGYEKILANEAALYHGKLQSKGRGWILAQWDEALPQELCFAYQILINPVKVSASSINGLIGKLLDLFTTHVKQKRIVEPWPLLFSSSGDAQLIHRAKTVEKIWLDNLQKRMSRVAKLSQKSILNGSQLADGLFVHFIDFDQAVVSLQAIGARQQRMQMDPQAPSRSYLKIEEAFHIFGCEPKKNDTVIDLGAAPGGWSYSALKRGACVTAIDNGPLKGPVASHPKISHLKIDAFKYKYDRSKPIDWLLCDILDEPDVILELLYEWLKHKRCRHFIVNLKVGRTNPIVLIKNIKDPLKGIASFCSLLHVKQLYHDREEITLMGK